MKAVLNFLFMCLFLVVASGTDGTKRPNVIFFLTDDWGFNDVGYNENTDTQTPYISKLATKKGLIISKHYSMSLCTVTRGALLTGRYPMRYGLQTEILSQTSNFALSRYETILSEEFKSQGYSTHLIGKWHLGYLGWDYTPTFRGFDSFFGYYGGILDYYDHTSCEVDIETKAYDFRSETEAYDESERYSMYMYSDAITSKLDEMSKKDPFFMYIGWQGSHEPSQAPYDYVELYSDEDDSDALETRINFQAQTTLTDQLFETMIKKLEEKDLWDDTLLIFASDNGADPLYGDNTPLRGGKSTLFEGGVRVPAFVTGGYLPEKLRGKVYDSAAMSVVDWYPTLLAAAGIDTKVSKNSLDGVNLWQIMQEDKDSEMNVEEQEDQEQLKVEQVESKKSKVLTLETKILSKYEVNEFMRAHMQFQSNDNNFVNSYSDGFDINLSDRLILLNVDSEYCEVEACGALIYGSKWKLMIGYAKYTDWTREFAVSESADILGCGAVPDESKIDTENCETNTCLFNLETDPCEYYDVSEDNEVLTTNLYKILTWYYDNMVPSLYLTFGDMDDWSLLVTSVNIGNEESSSLFWTPYYSENEWESVEFEEFLEDYYVTSESDMNSKSNFNNDYDSNVREIFTFDLNQIFIILVFLGILAVIIAIYKHLGSLKKLNHSNETNALLFESKEERLYSVAL